MLFLHHFNNICDINIGRFDNMEERAASAKLVMIYFEKKDTYPILMP